MILKIILLTLLRFGQELFVPFEVAEVFLYVRQVRLLDDGWLPVGRAIIAL